jgi:hypothetical protein
VWAAARKGDVSAVQKWLEHETKLERIQSAAAEGMRSAAASASGASSSAAAAVAPQRRAVDREDSNGLGFLHIAAILDHAPLIQMICDHFQPNLDAANAQTGLTPLHLAAGEGMALGLSV